MEDNKSSSIDENKEAITVSSSRPNRVNTGKDVGNSRWDLMDNLILLLHRNSC